MINTVFNKPSQPQHKTPSLILPDDFSYYGNSLQRPECVHCTSDGSVFTSNWQGGITHILPNGQQRHYLAKKSPITLRTNGFAITKRKTFLIANLGDDGGIWELTQQGQLTPFLTHLNNKPLPPCNYVTIDQQDRVWVSVSTRHNPREQAYKKEISDGFIVCTNGITTHKVADNLGYTNEIQLSPCQNYLYVNETFGRKLSRFAISNTGKLGQKEIVANFEKGVYPDGLSFDIENKIWVTSIISNRVIRVLGDGKQQVILQDYNPEHVLKAERAFNHNGLQRKHLDSTPNIKLKNVSSLAFGGKNRNIAYLGCLLDNKIARFTTTTCGIKPYHWNITL